MTSALSSHIGAALEPLAAVRAAWLFGSQRRGGARDDSDTGARDHAERRRR